MEITYKIIGTDGLQYGPIVLEQLKLWVSEGRIIRDTKVLRSDTNSWLAASQYTELAFAQPVVEVFPPTLVTIDNPALEKQIKSGADWFFWIAGLSLINSIIALSGNGMAFVLGLGITQVIDTVAANTGTGGVMVAAILDLLVAGIFIMFGVFGRKRHTWLRCRHDNLCVGCTYISNGLGLVVTRFSWFCAFLHFFRLAREHPIEGPRKEPGCPTCLIPAHCFVLETRILLGH